MSSHIDVSWLLPFAAGNFLYIAATDLLPELTQEPSGGRKLVLTGTFGAGLGLLLVVAVLLR